jgi:hypothetical protein
MNALRNWWYARLRKIDLQILWPQCRERSPDMDRAKAAFAVHAFHDRAWLILGEQEIYRRIDELK